MINKGEPLDCGSPLLTWILQASRLIYRHPYFIGSVAKNNERQDELFDKPVYGDVNGDGSEDAVVEIKRSGAPSLRSFEVHAYAFQNGQAKLLARVDDGRALKDYQRIYGKGDLHYAGNNPPKIQNGHVIVEALMDGSFACPKYTAVFDYKLSGGKFVLTGKPTRKQFKCNE